MGMGGNNGGACSQCNRVGVPLLVCDDFANENSAPLPHNPMVNSKNRYCAECMIGKSVRVFWPLDSQWYVGVVQEYDSGTGEHRLRYPDGDTEWVKIGDTQQGMGVEGTDSADVNTVEGLFLDKSVDVDDAPKPPDNITENGAFSEVLVNGDHLANANFGQSAGYSVPSDVSTIISAHFPSCNAPSLFSLPFVHILPPHFPSTLLKWPEAKQGSLKPLNDDPCDPAHVGAFTAPQPPYGHSLGLQGYGRLHPGLMQRSEPGYPSYENPYSPTMMGDTSASCFFGYQPRDPRMKAPSTPSQNSSPRDRKSNAIALSASAPSTSGISHNGRTKRKNGPKTWAKEEDTALLGLVQHMRGPMKWSVVAQSMPQRTGKQCRERYVNHLNPRLKVSDWSSVEDAVIFHLYDSLGSQWAKMAKMIPGRTDNGIKNRFHNLRRQLEREDEHRMKLSKSEDYQNEIHLGRVRELPEHLRGKTSTLWNMDAGIGILAAQSVLRGGIASRDQSKKKFGPFRKPESDGEFCARCGLIVPSAQCGPEICSKSRWCQTCTQIPAHLCSALLRECLNLRCPEEEELAAIVKSWSIH